MFIHEIMKINYVRQGYLANYPYHLLSDSELFNAFLCFETSMDEVTARRIKEANSDYSLFERPKDYLRHNHLFTYDVYTTPDNVQCIKIRGSKRNLMAFLAANSLDTEVSLSDECYFSDNYPLLFPKYMDTYNILVDALVYHLDLYLQTIKSAERYVVPNWVYSYMNGSSISINSPYLDKSGLFTLLNQDNIECPFTTDVFDQILSISSDWIKKLPPAKRENRPATIFGEPHVIKSLRLLGSAGSSDSEYN